MESFIIFAKRKKKSFYGLGRVATVYGCHLFKTRKIIQFHILSMCDMTIC